MVQTIFNRRLILLCLTLVLFSGCPLVVMKRALSPTPSLHNPCSKLHTSTTKHTQQLIRLTRNGNLSKLIGLLAICKTLFRPYNCEDIINGCDSFGKTALMYAASNTHPSHGKILRQLLLCGADPNLQDCSGKTALIHAIAHFNVGSDNRIIIRHLLKHGAYPEMVDNDGWHAHQYLTCIRYCSDYGLAAAGLPCSDTASKRVSEDIIDDALQILLDYAADAA